VSYFVNQNLALGISVGYSTNYLRQYTTSVGLPVDNQTVNTRSPSQTYSAGVFGQYYKMIGEQFGLTAQLGASYYQGSERGTNNGGSQSYYRTYYSTSQGYYLNLTPGIIFFPSKRLGLSLTMGSLGYERMKLKSFDRTASDFGVAFGLDQLIFGGTFYFGR